ncbi:hypothetical protein T02_7237 [Trichinella nativa]|uniref:Uncharacterized protein n=1 Tax=Trichinella nativa TaxID=6335 RepID=A0A0V1JVL1_9BILA|nr:hypothetical protein T02_7237 [Trichinella nativa]
MVFTCCGFIPPQNDVSQNHIIKMISYRGNECR